MLTQPVYSGTQINTPALYSGTKYVNTVYGGTKIVNAVYSRINIINSDTIYSGTKIASALLTEFIVGQRLLT